MGLCIGALFLLAALILISLLTWRAILALVRQNSEQSNRTAASDLQLTQALAGLVGQMNNTLGSISQIRNSLDVLTKSNNEIASRSLNGLNKILADLQGVLAVSSDEIIAKFEGAGRQLTIVAGRFEKAVEQQARESAKATEGIRNAIEEGNRLLSNTMDSGSKSLAEINQLHGDRLSKEAVKIRDELSKALNSLAELRSCLLEAVKF